MKKEFIKYSLLVLVCFSMMACNDWLSVKPKTEMEAEDLFSTEPLTALYPKKQQDSSVLIWKTP